VLLLLLLLLLLGRPAGLHARPVLLLRRLLRLQQQLLLLGGQGCGAPAAAYRWQAGTWGRWPGYEGTGLWWRGRWW
jgi:hypothetical protein